MDCKTGQLGAGNWLSGYLTTLC